MEQELNQEGATMEQPKEETSKETPQVTPTEDKKTSERTYSEAEWRKLQSMKDRAEASVKSVESELQQLRKEREQQRLERRQKEITDLEGEPDEQAKVRRKHQIEDELFSLQEQKTKEEGAVQRKYDQAIDLATQHNLSLADARELMKAESPREMELLAQLKIAERAKGQTPETTTSSFTPDSGTSDVGGRRSFTQRDIDNMSIEEYRKLKPEIEKAQREGRIK